MSTTEITLLQPSADEQWASIRNNTVEKLPDALKELTDNSFAAFATTTGDIHIHLTITILESGFRIQISDSGPGIPRDNIPASLSLSRSKRAGLNEHGMGIKNVLAFCCPDRKAEDWHMISRPPGSSVAYRIDAPWDTHMRVQEVDVSEHPFPSGLTIVMNLTDNKMWVYGCNRSARPNLEKIVKRIKEQMGVTYALHPLMNHITRAISFKINGEIITPLHPTEKTLVNKQTEFTQALAEGFPTVNISIKHYRLNAPNPDTKEYYRRNMASSGVLAYVHNRLVQRITPQALYDESPHNSFNPFLAVVCVTGDPSGIPSTRTTKDRLNPTDVRTHGLLELIRQVIPQSTAKDPQVAARDRSEAEMVREYVNRQETSLKDALGDAYSIHENKTWVMADGNKTPPIDVVEIFEKKVILIEAKKDTSKMVDYIMQLYRNYVLARTVKEFDGRQIKCMLLTPTKECTGMGAHILNHLQGLDSGFVCDLKSWDYYGISTAN
jgi:hypothetical protein